MLSGANLGKVVVNMAKAPQNTMCIVIEASEGKHSGHERSKDLGTLVRLGFDSAAGVAVIELHDPQRFNTMTETIGEDMKHAVHFLHERRDAMRAVTLQAAGSVFCAGSPFFPLQFLS